MDAFDAIVTKRDTRNYRPEAVQTDQLERVLQAGRMAGSAKNAQLSRVVVVSEPAAREALAECGDFTSWIASAPTVFVLCAPVEGGRLFDLGRIAQNIMVAAHDIGLATCPVTFHHQDRLRPVIGLPDHMEAPMGITIGYPGPAQDERASAPRLPITELVFLERWRD